jgi:hypothetical protein
VKNGVFWDVTPCGSCKTDAFEELSATVIAVTRIGELGTTLAVISKPTVDWYQVMFEVLVPANVPGSLSSHICGLSKNKQNLLNRAPTQVIRDSGAVYR